MHRLTSEEIRTLLKLLGQEVVVSPTAGFPFTISQSVSGYSKDVAIGRLQAKLSIMLEVATKSGN